jgi:hypothetical protein
VVSLLLRSLDATRSEHQIVAAGVVLADLG